MTGFGAQLASTFDHCDVLHGNGYLESRYGMLSDRLNELEMYPEAIIMLHEMHLRLY